MCKELKRIEREYRANPDNEPIPCETFCQIMFRHWDECKICTAELERENEMMCQAEAAINQ
jgi:hypothetical protein